MRVGILTSWRVPCGVYQYSSRMADALAKRADVEPVILAGRADEHRSVPEESPHEVHDVAQIGLWRDDGQYSLDAPYIGGLGLDVVHVQYQSMLFTQPHLMGLQRGRGWFDKILAVTYHDNCQAPDFPLHIFDLHFTHRWNVGPGCPEVIPFGIEVRPPVICTFGLGRSQSELLAPLCKRRGWIFDDISSHEPIHGAGQGWRTHDSLIARLRAADAIVLWYPPQDMAGSSQAVRTAMAARRPVFTNNTKWFEDLPDRHIKGYTKCGSLGQLERELSELFYNRYVNDNSWDRVAEQLVSRYDNVLSQTLA